MVDNQRKGDMSVSIVWVNMLDGDTEATAQNAATEIFGQSSVRHFYDPHRRAGEAIAESLGGLADDAAWDVYLFYEKGAEWGESLPLPSRWMHQCKGDSWANPDNYHWGDDLVQGLQWTMAKLADACT